LRRIQVLLETIRKVLEHALKVAEKVNKKRPRQDHRVTHNIKIHILYWAAAGQN